MNPILFILIILVILALSGNKKSKDILIQILFIGIALAFIAIPIVTVLWFFNIV